MNRPNIWAFWQCLIGIGDWPLFSIRVTRLTKGLYLYCIDDLGVNEREGQRGSVSLVGWMINVYVNSNNSLPGQQHFETNWMKNRPINWTFDTVYLECMFPRDLLCSNTSQQRQTQLKFTLFLYILTAKFCFTKTDLDHEPETGDRREAGVASILVNCIHYKLHSKVGLGITNLKMINFVDQDIKTWRRSVNKRRSGQIFVIFIKECFLSDDKNLRGKISALCDCANQDGSDIPGTVWPSCCLILMIRGLR